MRLTRIEMLVPKVTQIRFNELKKRYPGRTAGQLLAMLLDLFNGNTDTVVESVAALEDGNTDTVVESVAALEDGNTDTIQDQVADSNTDTVVDQVPTASALATELLSMHHNPADASAAVLPVLQQRYPGITIGQSQPPGTLGRKLFNLYNDTKKAIKKSA